MPLPPPGPPAPPPVLPNGDYRIINAQEIGGPIGDKFWRMWAREAIVRMKKGDLTFYTTGDGERTDVQIGNSLLSPFSTTAPDDTKLNNLDYIRANNPVPLAWDQYQ